MKFIYGMSQEEKDALVKKSIVRLAKALHNACNQAYKENNCNGCKYKVDHGCTLHGHPIEWSRKFK